MSHHRDVSDGISKSTSRSSGPTIREVAQRAGVSIKTVSRMLSGHQGVRDETRKKIQKVMDGMEYYPSAAARSLRGQKTGLVALIADKLTMTPDSFEIVKGVQSACDRHGKLLMIGETAGNPEVFGRLVVEFRRQRPEAVITACIAPGEIAVEQTFSTCPLVLVNCFEREDRYSTILPDDRTGAFEVTKHVLELGHRRIGHLGLLPEMIATTLRLQGYIEAHNAMGVPVDDALIRIGASQPVADEFVILPDILKSLFALESPPTVLMCGNDKMALRTLMLLNQMGLRVPEDVSLVGFDDYQLISENVLPSLTTVSLPYFEMGVRATEVALEGGNAGRVLIPCRVVPRKSVRPINSTVSAVSSGSSS